MYANFETKKVLIATFQITGFSFCLVTPIKRQGLRSLNSMQHVLWATQCNFSRVTAHRYTHQCSGNRETKLKRLITQVHKTAARLRPSLFLTCHWPAHRSAYSHNQQTTGTRHPNRKISSAAFPMACWKRRERGTLLDLSANSRSYNGREF